MFIYSHPVYPRRTWEVFFKRLYNFSMVLNFATWIIVFMDYVSRVNNTFENYWSSGDFQLYPPLQQVLQNCTFTSDFKLDHHTARLSQITIQSAPYMVMTVTSLIRSVFILHGVMIAFDFFAKMMFALNIRNFRIKGLHIPANSIFIVIVWCLSIAIICIIAVSRSMRKFMQTYVDVCADQFRINNAETFIEAEHDVGVVFGTVLDAILALVAINLCVYFLGFIHLLTKTMDEANARILRLDYPWEKGFMCKPVKAVIVQYAEERKQYEKSVMSIDVSGQLEAQAKAAAIAYNPTAAVVSNDPLVLPASPDNRGESEPTVSFMPNRNQYGPRSQFYTNNTNMQREDLMDEPEEQLDEDFPDNVPDGPQLEVDERDGHRKKKKKKKKKHHHNTDGTEDEREIERRNRRRRTGEGEVVDPDSVEVITGDA